MIISKIGNVHVKGRKNNQDFYLEGDRCRILTDGCSAGEDSDFGTRLFLKLFSTIENWEDESKFEENVSLTFEKIFDIFDINVKENPRKSYEFILNNLCFTISAIFEFDDCFMVKYLGDGYIVTQNVMDQISYIKIDYGKYPPYYVYNLMESEKKNVYKEKLKFNSYVFTKKLFKNVGLASDGIEPLVFEKSIKSCDHSKFDSFLVNDENLDEERNTNRIANFLQRNSVHFYDDTTIIF